MKKTKKDRGISSLYEFKDCNGVACSIQKSSLAFEQAIWLGADEGLKNQDGNIPTNYRMHLTQKQVKELLPILNRFAKTGEL
jgi:hypothetical protein